MIIKYRKTIKILATLTLLLFISFISNQASNTANTSALDYSSNTNVQFTFNPTLSVSVSDNLIIDELMPGTYSDSNIVDVSVSTNNVAGYSLSATVGTNSTNNRLVHTSDSNTYFSSLSSNISDLSSFSDNTWGYSYSTDSGSTWISGSVGSTSVGYNGLPQDTNTNASQRGNGGITLINSTDPADNQTIKFKIGAKAGSNQVAGTYTNTINFYAITKLPPISISDAFASAGKTQYNGYYKMQDMTAGICNFVQTVNEDSAIQLIDTRDNELYWVAKLKDNNCWMTQNLNFAPDASITYTHADTDLGYTSGNVNETWQPRADTMTNPAVIDFPNAGSLDSVSGWTNDYNKPHYAEGTTEGTKNGTEVIFYNGTKYTGLLDCATNSGLTETECEHYKIGNYYNWSAAVASNDTSGIAAQYTVMPNSVCPAGWRLPNGLVNNNGTIIQSEFNSMLSANGVANGTTLDTSTAVGGTNVGYVSGAFNTLMSNNPLYFVRSGNISVITLHNFSGLGYYWSSTAVSNSNAYELGFYSSALVPADRSGRGSGLSLRCLARNEVKTISDLNYLQDFANLSADELTAVKNFMVANQQYTLKDKRDGNDYTIKKINGEIWMTQNLRYLGDSGSSSGTMTIGNNNSNVENKSITLYSLNSSNADNFNPYSDHCDSTNGYNYACVYDSGNTTTGVWYNYAAATAGTITGASNTTTATQDICPAGWHLPSGPNTTEGTDFNKLVGNTTSGWQSSTIGADAFSATTGGFYSGGISHLANGGFYWSTKSTSNSLRSLFGRNDNNNDIQYRGNDNGYRYDGYFLRCVTSN